MPLLVVVTCPKHNRSLLDLVQCHSSCNAWHTDAQVSGLRSGTLTVTRAPACFANPPLFVNQEPRADAHLLHSLHRLQCPLQALCPYVFILHLPYNLGWLPAYPFLVLQVFCSTYSLLQALAC